MNAALRIGTPVAVGGVEGQIATIRVVEDGLFILNLRTASGLVAVTVRRNGDDLVPAPRAPVAVDEAVQVARRVVAGKEPRMPVAAVTSMLAAALVAVADGVTPTLTVPAAETPSHG